MLESQATTRVPFTVLQTLRTARRNVLEIIPDICTKQPMVSGKTVMVCWHMVMDPGALKRVLKDNLENYIPIRTSPKPAAPGNR